MKKVYVWKILSDDGLLKEPKTLSLNYDDYYINGYDGYFESEEEALERLEHTFNKFSTFQREDYVLVTIYNRG